MEYENKKLGVKFTIPDVLTVRQQLRFRSSIFLADDRDKYERFWNGAVELIDNWECELIPNLKTLDLDKETNMQITQIVQFVGNTVAGHMTTIGAVPKND